MDFATFSRSKKKERKKKEKKTKERHLYLIWSAGNIADILNSYLVRTYYILNVPSCRNLFVVLFAYRVAFFCMFLFSFIRFNLFALNVLFAFKNITREIEIVDYDK